MIRFCFFPFYCRKIALLFVLGRPLWREDGSVFCSAICQRSESRRTQNHTLLSHLRLLWSLSVASYDSQGLRWKHSYPPSHGGSDPTTVSSCSKSKLLYDWQSVSQSVCLGIEYPYGNCDQKLFPIGMLLSEICGIVSIDDEMMMMMRGRVCNLQCNHSIVRVAQNPKQYFTVSSETPPTWRARFPYLYPPGTGWPSYTSGTGFSSCCCCISLI
jgi:hypothetical protein